MKNTEISLIDLEIHLPSSNPEYKGMLANIKEKAPAVQKASNNFYKSHSQFMGVTLDVTAITPLRSIKHTLAEVEKTKTALRVNYFSLKKADVEVKKLKRKLETEDDDLERELIQIQIDEKEADFVSARHYVEGAIRKLNLFKNQYESLIKSFGKEEITEEDFEKEEIKYHIMTAMKQGLNAARSRGGIIDEGNLIYIFDLGINGAMAQAEVTHYLMWEEEMIRDNKAPEHHHTVKWLEGLAEKWADCPTYFASNRGFVPLDKTSLVNTPQLEDNKDAA